MFSPVPTNTPHLKRRISTLSGVELLVLDVEILEPVLQFSRKLVFLPEDGHLVQMLLLAEVGVHRLRGGVHVAEVILKCVLSHLLARYRVLETPGRLGVAVESVYLPKMQLFPQVFRQQIDVVRIFTNKSFQVSSANMDFYVARVRLVLHIKCEHDGVVNRGFENIPVLPKPQDALVRVCVLPPQRFQLGLLLVQNRGLLSFQPVHVLTIQFLKNEHKQYCTMNNSFLL